MSQQTSQPPDVRRAAGRAPSDPDRSGVPPAAHSSLAPAFPRRPLRHLLEEPGMSVTRSAASGGEVDTVLLTPSGAGGPRLAVKVPATRAAAAQVEREARMLVEVRRLEIGSLRATVPRLVQLCEQDGLIVLVANALPGRTLPGAFCGALEVSHRLCRPAELDVAARWLARFQEVTQRAPGPVDMLPPETVERLDRAIRPPGVVGRDARTVADRVRGVQELLARYEAPRSAVHGDFRATRILFDVRRTEVSGVLGWRRAATRGEPLVDVGRFAVTHTAHQGWGRAVPGATVLAGRGRHADRARRFIRDGLTRLGLPETLWYPVVWAAAASLLAELDGDDQPGRAAGLTRLLARTPDPTTAT